MEYNDHLLGLCDKDKGEKDEEKEEKEKEKGDEGWNDWPSPMASSPPELWEEWPPAVEATKKPPKHKHGWQEASDSEELDDDLNTLLAPRDEEKTESRPAKFPKPSRKIMTLADLQSGEKSSPTSYLGAPHMSGGQLYFTQTSQTTTAKPPPVLRLRLTAPQKMEEERAAEEDDAILEAMWKDQLASIFGSDEDEKPSEFKGGSKTVMDEGLESSEEQPLTVKLKGGPKPKAKQKAAPPSPTYSQGEEDEVSYETTKQHYRDRIKKDLAQKGHLYDRDSSDSEDALDETDLERSKAKRKALKLAELKAIAKQTRPLSDAEKKHMSDLQAKREADYRDRATKERKYEPGTQKSYATMADDFKKTSFTHNSILRKSYRRAITEQKSKEGGSKNYNQNQGKIRKELQKEIEKQLKEHDPSEFSDPDDLETLNYLAKQGVSNDKKKRRLHDAVKHHDTNNNNASSITEFHHVWFKESDKDAPAEALNPANLTMLHGERERKEGGVEFGAHEKAHQMQGFKAIKDPKKDWHKRGGGGQFSNMDYEATHYLTRELGKNPTPKKDLYKVTSDDEQEEGNDKEEEEEDPPQE